MSGEDVQARRAHADSHDREHQLAEAQALAHIGSWELDLTQQPPRASWSAELCRIFGRPADYELTGAQVELQIHPDDRERVRNTLQEGGTDGERSFTKYRILRPDGELRYVQALRFGRHDAQGNTTHLFGTIQDVTDQRRAEVARDEAESIFEMAFSQAPIGMAVVALDGRWLKVNQAICQITGYLEPELLARTFQDLTHPDDLDADLAHLERLLAGQITGYQMEKRYLTRDGGQIWVRLSVSLVRSEDGTPRYFISQINDISESKDAEQRLQEAERRARNERDHATAIITAMHEGYALTVGDEVSAVNEALCNLTGYSEAELVGAKLPFPFWPRDLQAENLVRLKQIVEQGGGTFEVTMMRKNGERFEAEVTARRAFDVAGDSIGFVNTVRDISGQLRQQRELERLARTDSLTGLANRRVLQETLERAAAQAREDESQLALILLDVDWFKQVNDRHGHPAGDAVLVEVARRLAATLRPGEVLARVGGEEFAWLLPGVTIEAAVAAADRARHVVGAQPFAYIEHLTISAGVGLMHAPADGDDLYRLADRALYDAKRGGRGRTSYLVAGFRALTHVGPE